MEEIENIENAQQSSVLNKINQKLRDFLLPGTKLLPQEETIMNIIYKIMNAPGTVKLTPRSGIYYLLNDQMHYFVRVQDNRVSIINSVDTVVKDCSSVFADFARRAIEESLERDLEKLDVILFDNESKLLKKIESKLYE